MAGVMNDRDRKFLGFHWLEWAIAACVFFIVAIPVSRYLWRDDLQQLERQFEALVGPVASGVVATIGGVLWLAWAWSKGLNDARRRGVRAVRPWLLLVSGALLVVAAVLFYIAA